MLSARFSPEPVQSVKFYEDDIVLILGVVPRIACTADPPVSKLVRLWPNCRSWSSRNLNTKLIQELTFVIFTTVFLEAEAYALKQRWKANVFYSGSSLIPVSYVSEEFYVCQPQDDACMQTLRQPCRHILKGRLIDWYHFWLVLNNEHFL
jgi:hypothetical protein